MTRDLLTLAQWLSPAFPVGAFAYSQGLEVAIQDGNVSDAVTLGLWVEDVLDCGAGRADAILLASAWRQESDVAEIARAFQPTAERLRETERMGAAFARTVRTVWHLDVPEAPYPVAVGCAAALRGIAVEETAALYLHAAAATLVSVAVRLVPLGQTEGQAVLASVTPLCDRIAGEAATSTLDDLASSTFLADIASMRHETLEPRIFQS